MPISLLDAADDEFKLPETQSAPPWASLPEEADDCYYGRGDAIEDHARTLSLYKDVIRLGGLIGYGRVGVMHENGEVVPQSASKALDFYRTGAEKGNYYCWAKMASLFHDNDSDENATKCWKRFFDSRLAKQDSFLEEGSLAFSMVLCDCCVYCMLNNDHAVLLPYLRGFSSEVREGCDKMIAHRAAKGTMSDRYAGIKRWISEI